MGKEKNAQTLIIAVLAVAVLVMSVGFAAYSQNLTINGTATVKSASWNIHFNNSQYTETTGSVQATSHSITDTTMTYTVTLNEPGDFYEFTINVVNDGTIDAVLSSINLTELTAEQQKYITHVVTYNGTDYSADQSNLSVPLNAGGTATVKVRVTYILPDSSSDLPSDDQTITLEAVLGYSQA